MLVVVAVSGTGGTGKTNVARALVKLLDDYKLVELNKLASRVKAYKAYDAARKSKIVNMEKLEAELKKLKKEHKNLIVEGLFAHEFKADVVVVLRCEPAELERRLRRKYSWPTKITENVEAEMMGIITTEALSKHGRSKVFEVDTTRKKSRETAEIVIEIINKKPKKYKAGKINWLGKSWYIRRIFKRPRRLFRQRQRKG